MSEDNDYIVARAERTDGEEPSLDLSVQQEREDEKEKVNEACEELVKSLADYADGLTSTSEETACARKLRDELSPYAPTRMEAFRTPPYAGRNCCGLLGVSYFLAALFYFVSFGGDRADGVVLVLVALGIFVLGGLAGAAAFLGARKAVRCLYPKKVSYNVFSESIPVRRQQGSRLVVIASNHDASPGSFFVNFGLVRKVVFAVVPVSAVLFVLSRGTPEKTTAFPPQCRWKSIANCCDLRSFCPKGRGYASFRSGERIPPTRARARLPRRIPS